MNKKNKVFKLAFRECTLIWNKDKKDFPGYQQKVQKSRSVVVWICISTLEGHGILLMELL